MEQHSYNLINGYPITRLHGRQFLIDTGLPFSVAERPLLLEGKRFEVADEIMGLSTESMRDVTGMKIDGILGGNVIDEFVLKIRPSENRLLLDHYLDDYALEIEIDNLGGLAIMHQTINGELLKAFLAVGARLSYVAADKVEGLTPVGYEHDVLGLAGEFETPVYQLPVNIGNQVHQFRFGVIPEQTREFIELANVQAAIGSEILCHYDLTLAMDEGVLMLDPLNGQLH